MQFYFVLVLGLLLGSIQLSAQYQKALFMQFPDIEGDQVVFVYNTDLYIVNKDGGTARRLTSHIGQETCPRFSPDGQTVAFTGEYLGGDNVFTVPVMGGEIRQLTWYPENNQVVDWTPDGQSVIFLSNRDAYSRYFDQFYTIGLNAANPQKLPMDRGSCGMFTGDARYFVYNRHDLRFWWWKRYQGSANLDVWRYDFQLKQFEQLTDYPGNDMWPMTGFDGYYFVSDRDGAANIYHLDPATRQVTQVTRQGFDGVSFPSIDFAGNRIVFINDGKLFCLDLHSREVKEIEVILQADSHLDLVEYLIPERVNPDISISPSAKRIAGEYRGEILSFPVEEGITRNYTQSSGARDHSPSWSTDGKWVAFFSDRDGEEEIYVVDQKNQGKPRRITDTKNFKVIMEWSPDSRFILYSTNDRRLYTVDLSSGQSVLIDSCDSEVFGDFNWAPDSRWLVYVITQRNGITELRLYNREEGIVKELQLPTACYSNPRFTPDGKGLVYLKANPATTGTRYGFYLSLSKGGEPWIKLKNDEEEPGMADDEKKKKKNKDNDEEETKPLNVEKIKIDFDGLAQRSVYIPELRGRIDNLQLTSKYIYFMRLDAGSWHSRFRRISLNYYVIDDKEIKQAIADIDNYVIAARAKKLAVYSNGVVRIVNIGSSAGTKKDDKETGSTSKKTDQVDVKSLKIRIDHRQEWRQIFNESFRMVKYNFYDPNMHGLNWDSLGAYYRNFLPYVASRQELNLLLQKLVGELNASHQGAYGGDFHGNSYSPPRYNMALLGCTFVPDDKNQYYRIGKIYPGESEQIAYRSPLDDTWLQLKSGTYIFAINGNPLSIDQNPYRELLIYHSKSRLVLSIGSEPDPEKAREITIEPIATEINLRYYDWIQQNARLVDSLSRHQIGYLHLRDMSGTGLREFRSKIKEYRYKQGLIIDVRYNGGGSIDPDLIDVLERTKYMTARERYGFLQERPDDGFYGKMAVLINEYSYSDAEVFPRAFQIKKLGKVIGVPTLGFVIAVVPSQLIDGGIVRKTFVGLWDNEGNMMESKGVQPDILVVNRPEDEIQGKDPQLLKAVEHLQQEIEADPRDVDYPSPVDPR